MRPLRNGRAPLLKGCLMDRHLERFVDNLDIYEEIPRDNIRALLINAIEAMPPKLKLKTHNYILTKKDVGYYVEAVRIVRPKLEEMVNVIEKRKANRKYSRDSKDFGLINHRIYVEARGLQKKYRNVKIEYIKSMIEGLLEGRAVKYFDAVVKDVQIFLEDKRIKDANRFNFKK